MGEPPPVTTPPFTSGPPPASSSSGYLEPYNPAAINQGNVVTPAPMALPVNTPLPGDSSTTRKFYTLSASLREIYDDNVNTTNVDKQSSLETELSPSVLVDFPTPEGDFSARYTFDLTYYSNNPQGNGNGGGGGTGGGNNSGSLQTTHEFVAQYAHAFSERFSLNLAEDFRYFLEPSLDENIGTNYQNGPYIANTFTGTASAQWTPLFGTTTTYSNAIVSYEQSAVADQQNSVENTGTQIFSFAVLPKVSASLGGIVDDITYQTAQRGYTTYTLFVGGQWQVLPSLTLTGRGGASYDETRGDQTTANQTTANQASISPYAAASLAWSLGARSQLNFDYAHEVTPSDQIGANGQTSDRFSASFNYNITTRLSAHLSGNFTNADITNQLSNSASLNGYNELQYYVDTGLNYQYNSYLGFDSGVTLSGVSSNITFNNYSRNEVYVGVRGTY